MKNGFEKLSKNNMLLSAVMVVLGLVLFIWPGKTLTLVARVLGAALLVGAAISGWNWYRERHVVGATYVNLAIAIACLVLGVVVLAAPKGVVSLLPRIIGIAVALNGILNLAQALDQRRAGYDRWAASLVMAVITILAGGFIFFHAFGAMKAAVMVIGGILVYNGASNLWIESRYRKLD